MVHRTFPSPRYVVVHPIRRGVIGVSDLQRYIVEEWAEDYQQGRLNRREFLRRTALMAGGTALALSMLRSLGVTATLEEVTAAATTGPTTVVQASGTTVPPDDPSLQAGMVSFQVTT